jgi:hypothetical protein
MEHIKKLLGPNLFNIWLAIVCLGLVSWTFDLTVTAVRHQIFFCR